VQKQSKEPNHATFKNRSRC